MNAYFTKKDAKSQVLFLNLIADKFQENLNVKPLLEKLDSELPGTSEEKRESPESPGPLPWTR